MKYITGAILVLVALFFAWRIIANDSGESSVADTESSPRSAYSKSKAEGEESVSIKSKSMSDDGANSAVDEDARKKAVLQYTMQAARKIKAGIDVFSEKFDGELPSEDTGKKLKDSMPEGVASSNGPRSANWFLQQLIASGAIEDEAAFQLPFLNGAGIESDLDGIVESGECGFSYIPNTLATDSGDVPVLVAPMKPNSLEFDAEALGGKAVVVFLNGLITSYDINSDGSLAADGEGLFEINEDSVRGGGDGEPITARTIAFPLASRARGCKESRFG